MIECINCTKLIEENSLEINRTQKNMCRSCDKSWVNGWNAAVLSHSCQNHWLRSLTAKPSRNATQRERDIYRLAVSLLKQLEA